MVGTETGISRSSGATAGHLYPQAARERIAALLAAGAKRAEASGRPAPLSLTWRLEAPPDPVVLFAAAGGISDARALWSRPADGLWMVSAGQAADIKGTGGDSYRQVAAAQQDIVGRAIVEGMDGEEAGLLFVGGFKFDAAAATGGIWDGFPDGSMTLPRWSVWRRGGACRATVNLVVDNHTGVDSLCRELAAQAAALSGAATRPEAPRTTLVTDGLARERWRQSVEPALEAIARGDLAKVVLARTLRLTAECPLQPAAVLRRLVADYPGCRVFAYSRGGRCFLGATPEELVSLKGGIVTSTCMAGSAGRGVDPAEDSLLSSRLLMGEKERREHAFVADLVGERMGRFCAAMERSAAPEVVKLGNVQHLATRFSGVTSGEPHVLDFVAALHPTPAVGGIPAGPALEAIRRLEGIDRGWYGGPVGWMSGRDGEFGVAIRSALLSGNEAILYAGAGIVSGSDPDSEYEETEMKFRPLLAALAAQP